MGFLGDMLLAGAMSGLNSLLNSSSKTEIQSDNPYVNIIKKAFQKGDLSFYKAEANTKFKDLDYDGREKEVVHELYVIELNSIAVTFHVSFLTDCIFIRGNDEWEKYKYEDISQVILRGKQLGTVDLIFLDNNGKECFCKTFRKYLIDKNSSVLEEFADLLNELITQEKGQKVKTKYEIEVEDEMFFTAFLDNNLNYFYDEKEKQNWVVLLNKWNEILSRETSVKYLECSDSEKAKFPDWKKDLFSNPAHCYTVNDGIIIKKNDEISVCKSVDYYYLPNLNSKTKKYACCRISIYLDKDFDMPDAAIEIRFVSGDIINKVTLLYFINEPLKKFHHNAFPEKEDNPIHEFTFVNFMNFLGKNYISENFLNLKNKMQDAEKTFEIETEKKQEEQRRKQNEQKILEEKRQEQAKLDALNDF